MRCLACLLAGMIIAVAGRTAQADSLQLIPVITEVQALNPDGTIGAEIPVGQFNPFSSGPVRFSVDVRAQYDPQGAATGFGNVDFSINFTGGFSRVPGSAGYWRPDMATIINPETGDEVSVWADNGDLGPFLNNLRHIVMGFAPRDFFEGDPRRTYGQEPLGVRLGGVRLNWDGNGNRMSLVNLEINGFSNYGADNVLRQSTGTSIDGQLILGIPEPSTWALLGIGSVMLLLLRRIGIA